MPDLNETRYRLENAFITGWGTTTPIAYDNVYFDDDGVDEYVLLRFVVYNTENMTIGSQLANAVRHYEALVIKVYTKIGSGSGTAWEYADQIKTLMANKGISANLYTLEAEVRRDGDSKEGYFSVVCSIRYRSEEC